MTSVRSRRAFALLRGSALSIVACALAALVLTLAHRNRALGEDLSKERARARSPRTLPFVPTFRTATLQGDSVTIGERADGGRQVLVVFTTTCPYCRASLPAWKRLAALADTMSSPRVEVLGVALDSSRATIDRYAAEHTLPYRIVQFPQPKLAALYRSQRVPVTMVLNGDGRVIFARVGVVDTQAAEDSIVEAIRWIGRSRTAEPSTDSLARAASQ